MRMPGIILALGYYLSIMIFYGNYIAKGMIWLRSEPSKTIVPNNRISLRIFGTSVCDILFFRRLLSVNDVLWLGEWIFHFSFLLVILRHLRYFINPIPQWIWGIQTTGVIARYILPVALVYIVVMKVIIEKKKYVATYNFFLIAILFLIGVTGLLMKIVFRPDVLGIKEFILGAVTFRFVNAPESALFITHFLMFLVLLTWLPTHIFAAPLTLFASRQREELVKGLVHEK